VSLPALLGWLDEPDADRGVRFFRPPAAWAFCSYRVLARATFAAAERLRDAGAGPGTLVAVATGSAPEFVAGFFGAVAAGATPVPVAAPALFERTGAYAQRLRWLLAASGATYLVTVPEFAAQLAAAAPEARQLVLTMSALDGEAAAPRAPARPSPVAMVHFTSGSSGRPRPVAVPAGGLRENIEAISRWLAMRPGDAVATWLPVHHDMGLTGCLLTPILNRADLWVMRPQDFVRDPVTWLSCFGGHGARLTAAPPFGLSHVVQRVRARHLAGLGWDMRHWRGLIVGAERIEARVLDEFARLLRPFGFSPRAFLPAYGLAEATLAVTGAALADVPRTVLAARRSLVVGGRVRVRRTPGEGRAVSVVSCGAPLVPGSSVRIVSDNGETLPHGFLGEIVVTGPALARDHHDAGGSRFRGAELFTGDSGFLDGDDLFVLGRLGDAIKRRAGLLLAEDLETAVRDVPALRRARAVVLLGVLNGDDTAILVAERRAGPWIAAATRVLRRAAGEIRVIVVAGPAGTVRRTTSGKPRRRPMWTAFAAGTLGGDTVADVAPRAGAGHD